MRKPAVLLQILVALTVLPASAQSLQEASEVLSRFSVQEGERTALIEWTIKGGKGCSQFFIEHSTDGVNYREFYKYPGFCGGEPVDIRFFTYHKNPEKGKVNHYRLYLGEFGYSRVESFYVPRDNEPGYSLFPLPATSQTVLHFRNPHRTDFRLQLFEASGRECYSRTGIITEEVAIGALNLRPGTYFFTLTNGSERFTGKFVQP
jgi:hypothetical protein